MSRSAKKLLLLLPVFIVVALTVRGGSFDGSSGSASSEGEKATGSLPALAARQVVPQAEPTPSSAGVRGSTTVQSIAPVERPPREQRVDTVTIRMLVTAYCPCPKCCGKHSDGVTASGKDIYTNDSRFVAADTSILPLGTRVSIPGYNDGEAVPVLDRGGKIKGHRLDVFFLSHQRALQWGRQWVDVTVHLD
ncbi:MAG: 3D domain-containing protein [Phycisphaerae bacterium]